MEVAQILVLLCLWLLVAEFHVILMQLCTTVFAERPHLYGYFILANYQQFTTNSVSAIEYKIICKDKVTITVRALTHPQTQTCSINWVNTVSTSHDHFQHHSNGPDPCPWLLAAELHVKKCNLDTLLANHMVISIMMAIAQILVLLRACVLDYSG